MKAKLFLSITTGLLFFSLSSCKSIKEKLIESGEYKFSKNIGKFGGYRIPLKNHE